MTDPIVEEVRRHRNQHTKIFGYNLDAICEDYKKKHNLYLKKIGDLKNSLATQRHAGAIRKEKMAV